jgi:hypothetical protein
MKNAVEVGPAQSMMSFEDDDRRYVTLGDIDLERFRQFLEKRNFKVKIEFESLNFRHYI